MKLVAIIASLVFATTVFAQAPAAPAGEPGMAAPAETSAPAKKHKKAAKHAEKKAHKAKKHKKGM